MSLEVKGEVTAIFETEKIGAKGFPIRKFFVRHGEKYVQENEFQLTGDKVSLLDDVFIGDPVTVSFNLRGKQSNDGKRCWNSLEAWKIQNEAQDHPQNAQKQAAKPQTSESRPSGQAKPKVQPEEDIPFF